MARTYNAGCVAKTSSSDYGNVKRCRFGKAAHFFGRWVQVYGPELDKRCRPHLKPTNKSYRVDET